MLYNYKYNKNTWKKKIQLCNLCCDIYDNNMEISEEANHQRLYWINQILP